MEFFQTLYRRGQGVQGQTMNEPAREKKVCGGLRQMDRSKEAGPHGIYPEIVSPLVEILV